jgi:hypothetical protein
LLLAEPSDKLCAVGPIIFWSTLLQTSPVLKST